MVGRRSHFNQPPETKSCPSCFRPVPIDDTRCPSCGFIFEIPVSTSWREINNLLQQSEIDEKTKATFSSGARSHFREVIYSFTDSEIHRCGRCNHVIKNTDTVCWHCGNIIEERD